MIKIENVHKHFGRHHVLKGINLHIKHGEKVVILGPSGSGKSTLIRCINHLEKPSEGHILVDGIDVTAHRASINKVRQMTAMVFQNFNLYPHKTVLENITLAPVKVQHVIPRMLLKVG